VDVNRRAFLGSVAGLVLAPRLTADPRKTEKVSRIGYLSPAVPTALEASWLLEFRAALNARGHSPEARFVLEERYASDRTGRLPALARELLDTGVDVILAFATPASLAAKAASRTIPVVMVAVGDPIGVGLVSSLNRPEANVTGLTLNNVDSAGKRLELLKEAAPRLLRVAVLANPSNASFAALQLAQIRPVADRLGVTLVPADVAGPDRLAATFAAVVREGANGVVVLPDATFIAHRERIASLALQHRLPSVAPENPFVGAGCLLAYGPDVAEIYRQAARFVDRILKGAKPTDLPVEQPATYELALNRRTAKALGLTVPASLLLRANEVIG
jgi:putative ABC transport system substrate-binding protein